MASILFLVLGDMTAAIIGVSFGGDALGTLKLGREGKKSLEGYVRAGHLPIASAVHSAALDGRRLSSTGARVCPRVCSLCGRSSLAMFFVCFLVGSTIFTHVRLREYPVFFGALVATLTELHEPLRLNDNLTIPVFSSIAMQLAFQRIATC